MAVDFNVLLFHLKALSWAAIFDLLEAPLAMGITPCLAIYGIHSCDPCNLVRAIHKLDRANKMTSCAVFFFSPS
jgi:hypothetical protein